MQIETLKDVLIWTSEFHQDLSRSMMHCADKQKQERAQLLFRYLADHEQKLATILTAYHTSAKANVLNTSCYEYLNQYPLEPQAQHDKPFADMTSDAIIQELEQRHLQVINLYRHLLDHADSAPVRELLTQLTLLEQHEAMQLVHTANRLEDL